MATLEYIHQIWYQGADKVPDKYNEYRRSIRRRNPRSRIIVWDTNSIADLIDSHFPQYKDWFNSLPLMIQQIDVAKCLILAVWGGVYVDMDIECLKPFSPLYDSERIVVGEVGWNKLEDAFLRYFFKLERRMINNGIIFSPPKHAFWDYYIPFLKNTLNIEPQLLERLIQELYVTATTGPANFTAGLCSFPEQDQITVLEPKYLEPQLIYTKDDDYGDSYIIHHHALSWCGSFFGYCVNNLTGSSLLTVFLGILMVIAMIVGLWWVFAKLL